MRSICEIPDCGLLVHAHGLCKKHLARVEDGCPVLGRKTHDSKELESQGMTVIPCLRFPHLLVSSEGHVIGRNGTMKQYLAPSGYKAITTRDQSGRVKVAQVHVLICESFHGPRPSRGHVAAHNDGVKTNNRSSNLRWATYKENAADKKSHGTDNTGVNHPACKLTEEAVRLIRAGITGEKDSDFAQRYGVTASAISQARIGRSWSHI